MPNRLCSAGAVLVSLSLGCGPQAAPRQSVFVGTPGVEWAVEDDFEEATSGLLLGPEGLEWSRPGRSIVLDPETGAITLDRGRSFQFYFVVGVDGSATVFMGNRDDDSARVLTWVDGNAVARQVEASSGNADSTRVSDGEVYVSSQGYARPSVLERTTHDGRSWSVGAELLEVHPHDGVRLGRAVNVSDEIAVVALNTSHAFTFDGAVHEEVGNYLFGLDRDTGETRWFVHTGSGESRGEFTVVPGGYEHLVELEPGEQITIGGKTLTGPDQSTTERRSKLVRIRGDAAGTHLDVSEFATIAGFMGPIERDRDGYVLVLNVPGDCHRPKLVRLDGSGTVTQTRDLYPASCSQDPVHVSIGRMAVSPDGEIFVAGRLPAPYVLKLSRFE